MTTLVHCYHYFSPSSFTNINKATLQSVVAYLRIIQKFICKCCGRIGHKAGACIIRRPKFLPPSLGRKMNKFNSLHGDEPTDPPRDWNIQPLAAHFKSSTSPPKTNPVVSAIMGRLNHHAICNVDVEVYHSYFPFEYNSKSVPYPYITPI